MIKTDREDLINRAMGRSHIYGLLAHLYSHEPTPEFLKKLLDPDFQQLLKELGSNLTEELKGRPLNEVVEELAVEYTRLFIGPGSHIYPYQSAYCREDTRPSPAASEQVEILIKRYGLEHDRSLHQRPDHISVELAFMEKATEAEAKARGEDDDEKVIRILELERQFMDEHLIQWIPQFSDKVFREASLSFYREIAKLTKEYMLLEAQKIKELIGQIKTLDKRGGLRDV